MPVALPFAVFDKIDLAIHISNGIALLMLFIGGYLLAGHAGLRKLLTAVAYVVIGIALVSLTMALGG